MTSQPISKTNTFSLSQIPTANETSLRKISNISTSDGDGRIISLPDHFKHWIIQAFIRKIFKDDHDLLCVDFSYRNLGENDLRLLAQALLANTSLRTLILKGNRLSEDSARFFSDVIDNNHTLDFLDLSQCQLGEAISVLLSGQLSISKSEPHLGTLILSNNDLSSNEAGPALGNLLSISKTLRVLDLSNNNLKDDGVKLLLDSVNRKSSLRSLKLSNNGITEAAMISLYKALENFHYLKELDLSKNSAIGDRGCLILSYALLSGMAGDLHELDLSETSLTLEGAKGLAFCVNKHPSLELMNLKQNQINDAGAILLTESLVTAFAPRHIILEENKFITAEGMEIIENLLGKMNSSSKISLRGSMNLVGNSSSKNVMKIEDIKDGMTSVQLKEFEKLNEDEIFMKTRIMLEELALLNNSSTDNPDK